MKLNLKKLILPMLAVAFGLSIATAQQPHVYINPGHGGHESDDRNVVIPGFAAGDTAGFWESNASLWKGFALQEVLRKKGYKTSISRVTNDENSDLALSTIVALCNASGADVFYAIHSNATGAGEGYRINFPLGLYRGYTGSPVVPGSDKLCQDLGVYLLANQSTVWTENNYRIAGDWTFYPEWNNQGLGVLRGNQAVAMLDEGSFHDYIPEAQRLVNHDYCWVEGWNFSLGADRFFGRLETDGLPVGIVTGNLRDDRLLRAYTFVMHGADARCPVNNATVKLIDAAGNVVQTTHTDNIDSGIYLFKYVEPGTYTVEVTDEEHFPQTKEVTVEANLPTYCNFDLKRVRNTPPEVISHSPVWHNGDASVKCNEPVVFQFNWDMDIATTEAAFSITPAVQGSFTWEDTNYRLVFRPDDAFATDTHYTVRLAKTAQHAGGTPMDDDFVMEFTTQGRNHIDKVLLWPEEGSRVYDKSVLVEFRTDSLLDSKDLLYQFTLYDKDGNEMAWNKRSVKNNKKGDTYGYIRLPLTKNLTVGEPYRLEIGRDVCDTIGLHLPAPITVNFIADDFAAEDPAAQKVFDMESTDGWTTEGNFVSATLSSSTSHITGSKSLQCKWDVTGTDNPVVNIVAENPGAVNFTDGDSIVARVWGDMSNYRLEAVFKPLDMADMGDVTVEMTTVNFHGWQRVAARAVKGENGPYALSGFRLTPKDPRMGITGTVLINDVLCKAGPGGSGVDRVTLPGVTVGPNPSSDYIVASAPTFVAGVELVDLNGRVVVRNAGNYVNVSSVAAGNYLLRVYVNNLVSTHKVAVVH